MTKYKLKDHLCGKIQCKTCKAIIDDINNHLCYMRKPDSKKKDILTEEEAEEKEEENEKGEGYNELFFFDYEARQEDEGIHKTNLCIVHNESGDEWIFQGEDTNSRFCEWLFTKEHRDCIFVAHNFQGYDGYFIQNFLNENAVKYDIILRDAKILSLTVPMFNIKFIDSLNFIPMSLSNFPKTFGMNEMCKGYFPHSFNRRENQDYIGPIPCEAFYNTNGMKEEARNTFIKWHKEKREQNYVFNFQEEIIKYCRSDVDILRRCCMEFRELFRSITNIDPFEKCLTIASACNLVFRTNFLKEETIGIFQNDYQMKVKQSNMAFKWLSYISEKEEIFIQHGKNGGEKRVDRYSLDGYNPELNTAYEFQGCIWHGCEKCYTCNTVNPVNGKTMSDLFEATLKKNLYLKECGYNVIEMWECDLKRNLEQDEEMRVYFENFDLVDPLQPRDAFYGGRTNATKLFHECKDNEKIRYVDFTSLYPWCNKSTKTIVGHPIIITENFRDISTYFGLIKCTVLPPRGLFHPVLLYRVPGKLLFPLCKACAISFNQNPCTHTEQERSILGTWCHVELLKAIEKGLVNTFLKIKQEASGFPKDCITEEQKQSYINMYEEHEDIKLEMEKIEHNPGLRALAKLMLNSFWGKFAQRSKYQRPRWLRTSRYFELLSSDQYEIHDVKIVNDNMLEVQYKNTNEFLEVNNKTNIVIAAFTTAYARLKLYDLLDTLGERALYYDTDSVIYVSKENELEPPLGNYLGDLTDELNGKYITTFMSGGPKNYAYYTNDNKSETKIRGITLNHSVNKKINPSTVRALVYLHAECKVKAKITVTNPFKITRDKQRKNIVTKEMKKDYRIIYDKRVLMNDFKTIPYGF
ncbi:uncharacterized protein LOC114531373 [Dendronephthya gigantea]|uniref:uncharacterized protein LOC114531373 n=1 Tax=Dendronephthya gigantea TaxID=151771 RepID=UPI00106A560B|nr:uncharacterized protein LOC114531373 [Dendronephthya gigantea]